jgi:hypothetical protein
MKKLAIVFGAALFLTASCAKDYSCKCTTTDSGVAVGSTTSTVTGKKKDAEAACNAGDASVGTLSVNCEIQ